MPSITLATQTVATQTGTAVPTIPTTVLTNSLTALDTTASTGATSNADNTALPLFGCRAFVNFSSDINAIGGENRCQIKSSGNISKIVRANTGNFLIYFVTPMPDVHYVVNAHCTRSTGNPSTGGYDQGCSVAELHTTYFRVFTQYYSSAQLHNAPLIFISVFR